MPYTYIVRCKDGSYYTGSAKCLKRRVEVHNSGKGAKYTRSRLPVQLVYFEEFEEPGDARKREVALKRLNHVQKEELVKGFEESRLVLYYDKNNG